MTRGDIAMHNDSFVWNQYDLIRRLFLESVSKTTEEEADIVPTGFRNNIRWNVGHIFLTQGYLLFGPTGVECPQSYAALFSPGTKPADWQGDIPSLETLHAQLTEQHARIKERLQGRLNEPLPKPFELGDKGVMHTYGEMMVFTLFHEGMHFSAISSLRKAIAAAKA
ncbi:DinB family protein [Brevibacillus sp. SAFN-007a]|uniref:DinB family protein n=1 Tax=Brevibacillus sp. SAFN-007a TaxID=3436862 RepID=UPI003F7E83DA